MQADYTTSLFNNASHLLRDLEKAERARYRHPEYSDGQIDGLMRYFKFETYIELLDFMKKAKNEKASRLLLDQSH